MENLKKIKMGIVGLNFGKAIVRQIRETDAGQYIELSAICDLDKEKTDMMSGDLGVKAYYELDDLLEDPEIAAVGLFTGPAGRAGYLRKIIRSGRDVVTTKPFEMDPDEALSVLREARELGRTIHLNSPAPLLSDDLLMINEWQEKYQLGRPVAFHYSVWKSVREEPSGSWYDDLERCPAAPVYRIGIYLINDIVRILGEADCVNVMTSQLFTKRPTADNAQIGIKFKNGAIGTIFASFCVLDSLWGTNKLVLNYENGTVYKYIRPSAGDDFESDDTPNLFLDQAKKPLVSAKCVRKSGQYQWQTFYQIVNGEKIDVDLKLEEIVEGVKIVNAMKRATFSGATEKV